MKKLSSQVGEAKRAFNDFFRRDLYGRFDHPENILLSRGSWRDEVVRLPQFFRFCTMLALERNWTGYSDSLGHERVYDALLDWANIGREKTYGADQLVITMGNVATMGAIFRELKEVFPDGELLTLEPFYPSIVKSAGQSFPSIHTVSSLSEDEGEVFEELKAECQSNPKVKILLLSNFIGVEGRIFSAEFWGQVFEFLEEKDLYLVIDEGMWLKPLEYPEGVNSQRVIRVVSSSKKYGNPGMKMGYMLAPVWFRERYYEQASTSYGGPPSLLFLAGEFMYQFEHAHATDKQEGLDRLTTRYNLPDDTVRTLFTDFQETLRQNEATYLMNRGVFEEWLSRNNGLFRRTHVFHGINIFLEPDCIQRSYPLFEELIQAERVSVFPGVCLGDESDRICRVTILESQAHVQDGLERFASFLARSAKIV